MSENKKGTLFCIHGNSSSSKVFEDLKQNQNSKYDVFLIDLLGHGTNQEKQNMSDFSLKSQKEYLLKQLKYHKGNVILVGHSLGGHLAIEIAEKIDNLKGLIIIGTPPVKKPMNLEEAFLPIQEIQTFFTENPIHKDIESIVDIALQNKKVKEEIISNFKSTNPLVRKSLALDMGENNFSNQFDIFINLTCPKFMIIGDSDPIVNRDYLEFVKNHCTSFCELITLKNCGHYPSLEISDFFIKKMQELVDKIPNHEVTY